MISGYEEEEYLQLSGLQHFLFCRRQWGLIHIEQQWLDNGLTSEGTLMHERAHDEDLIERRGTLLIVRGMRISSKTLGVSGACDVVEFHQTKDGISLPGEEGTWEVEPVEYKHGKTDYDTADAAQLCGEAMCLEEMLCCQIPYGFLMWGEAHRRERIDFMEELRKTVRTSLQEMHQDLERGYTPKSKPGKKCVRCSMKDVCLPELEKNRAVKSYIHDMLGETS